MHSVPLAIGLDLGGSKVAGGVVDGTGAVVERLATSPAEAHTPEDVLRTVLDIVAGVRRRHAVDGIGIGVAGLVDWPAGRVRWSFNTGYDGMELRRLVADATGLRVVVDNDANAAAWGEAYPPGGAGLAGSLRSLRPRLPADSAPVAPRQTPDSAGPGAADGYLAMLCVGSGLGGGFVLGGEVYRGATGIGAEIGHLPVDSGSTELCGCGCGLAGNLGTLACGPALARAARRAAAADPDGLIARLGRGPQGVTGQTATEAARLGDPAARELFARMGHWLGVGASVLVTLLDLRRIVVGGGLVAASDLYLDQMRETMRRHTFAHEHRELPSITPARLGAEAGWVGAGLLALHRPPPTTGER
ncbi:ROK family glucokinase [Phytohabitans rumicis]